MTKRDGRALWRALKEQEAEDDFAEIEAMSDAELDKYIDDNGGDSKAIRASTAKLIEDLTAARAKKDEEQKKIEAFRRLAAEVKPREKLSREDLIARVKVARLDPRFRGIPAAMMFYKKTPEECTDEELESMLSNLELLARLGKG